MNLTSQDPTGATASDFHSVISGDVDADYLNEIYLMFSSRVEDSEQTWVIRNIGE